MSATEPLICSFCGKSAHEVTVLFNGHGATYICDECVELAHAIVVEQGDRPRMQDCGIR